MPAQSLVNRRDHEEIPKGKYRLDNQDTGPRYPGLGVRARVDLVVQDSAHVEDRDERQNRGANHQRHERGAVSEHSAPEHGDKGQDKDAWADDSIAGDPNQSERHDRGLKASGSDPHV